MTLSFLILLAVVAGIVLFLIVIGIVVVIVLRLRDPGSAQSSGGWIVETPSSAEGYPVDPSNIPVQPETPLNVGSTVLSYSQGRWWRAQVVAVSAKTIRIHFPGWDSKWDTDVPRIELQVDIDNK